MKEFELQIRVRNNRLKERRLALGVSQNTMNDAIGLKSNVYHKFEMFVQSPFDLDGGWTPEALLVAEYFDVEPGELFPPSVMAVTSPSMTRALDGVEIESMMSVHTLDSAKGSEVFFLEEENAKLLFDTVKSSSQRVLSDFERSLFRDYYGIGRDDIKTFKEIGKGCELSESQVQQLMDYALSRLRGSVFRRLEKIGHIEKVRTKGR